MLGFQYVIQQVSKIKSADLLGCQVCLNIIKILQEDTNQVYFTIFHKVVIEAKLLSNTDNFNSQCLIP